METPVVAGGDKPSLTRFYILISISIASVFGITGTIIVLAAGASSNGKPSPINLTTEQQAGVFGGFIGSLITFTLSGLLAMCSLRKTDPHRTVTAPETKWEVV
jgi:hypothetical protein